MPRREWQFPACKTFLENEIEIIGLWPSRKLCIINFPDDCGAVAGNNGGNIGDGGGGSSSVMVQFLLQVHAT